MTRHLITVFQRIWITILFFIVPIIVGGLVVAFQIYMTTRPSDVVHASTTPRPTSPSHAMDMENCFFDLPARSTWEPLFQPMSINATILAAIAKALQRPEISTSLHEGYTNLHSRLDSADSKFSEFDKNTAHLRDRAFGRNTDVNFNHDITMVLTSLESIQSAAANITDFYASMDAGYKDYIRKLDVQIEHGRMTVSKDLAVRAHPHHWRILAWLAETTIGARVKMYTEKWDPVKLYMDPQFARTEAKNRTLGIPLELVRESQRLTERMTSIMGVHRSFESAASCLKHLPSLLDH
ncbi:MAG: hypothetical protein Q9220_007499 [cf. Caloplaca sp. 1 TL-2023]